MYNVESASESEDSDYAFSVETVGVLNTKNRHKKIFAAMRLGNETINFQLDSGSTVNILPIDVYKKAVHDSQGTQLQSSKATLVMFNKSELKPLGSIKLETVNPRNNQVMCIEFVVVSEGHMPILGVPAIQQFGLMTVNSSNIMHINELSIKDHDSLVDEFGDVFTGEGKFEGKLHLEIDETVKPVTLPVRKVPLAVKQPLKKEIECLVEKGVLEPVDVPTDWVSSMVVVKKSNGKIRLCIDPKPLNKALKRNLYPLPVIDELLPELTNAKVFSVVDAKNGFWHVELDDESGYLTTFGTPWGRYRWTRMPFGISPAPEEFQRRLVQALDGLDSVKPIFDDILVFGVGETKADAIADHDKKLTALLERCRAKGVKLNRDKLKLRLPEVTFMGHVISEEGLKADPVKVQGIKEMPIPENKQDVKRLMGMVNYLQRFTPNLSDVSAPLRDLLKEENQFHWDEDVQGRSFGEVRKTISEAPTLKYFDPQKAVELQCDASQRGLGACLLQDGQPVAYASRAMTETESRYAQIEKEMLAIVFGVGRFEQYVYGRPVHVETDHKPLESIFKKSLISAPKRLQRMLLRLQKFDLFVSYKKGSEMVLADTLSRAYRKRTCASTADTEDVVVIDDDLRGETEKEVEHINMIQYLPVTEATQAAIQKATESDDTLMELKSAIRKGWPVTKEEVSVSIREYFPFREELTLQNGLIFKGERLVIPTSMRSEMLSKLHKSHIGVQGCLRRAREALYWPNMNRDVEQFIYKCDICNKHPAAQGKEPLICHEIPTRPWEKVAADLFDFEGKDFLITVDYYSGFFEVDRLHSKSASKIIKKLKAHFARHGIPDRFMSDNQPFTSFEFEDFAKTYGFEQVTSSPNYPQSNGKVENAVKTAKTLMRKAEESESDPYLSLLDWRNTPTEILNTSPAQQLFNRRTKTLLPTSNQLLKLKVPVDVLEKMKFQKAKQSINYNKGAKELGELRPGDTVRLQPTRSLGKSKEWLQAKVEGKVDIRSYQVRTEDGRVYRRNRRHLRRTREVILPREESVSQPLCRSSALPTPANADESDQHLPATTAKPTADGHHPAESAGRTSVQPTQEAPAPLETAETRPSAPQQKVTRSGRVVKPPLRFQ